MSAEPTNTPNRRSRTWSSSYESESSASAAYGSSVGIFGCDWWKWEWARKEFGARDRPAALFTLHHPKTHSGQPWPTKLVRLISFSFFWTISHPFFFTTGSFTKDDRGDYFPPNTCSIRSRLPVPKRLMVAFVLSFLSYTMHPLPSASFSIHSQSTPVVEKLRVERVHLIL